MVGRDGYGAVAECHKPAGWASRDGADIEETSMVRIKLKTKKRPQLKIAVKFILVGRDGFEPSKSEDDGFTDLP